MRALPLVLLVAVASGAGVRGAEARRSGAIRILAGGVEEVAVGETLDLRAYPPRAFASGLLLPGAPPPLRPLDVPLLWSVEPPERAAVTETGRLVAYAPGRVVVHVRDAREVRGGSPHWVGSPGTLVLEVAEHVPGGRLPRVAAGSGVEAFALRWGGSGLVARASTLLEDAQITLAGPVRAPLPWAGRGVPAETTFARDDGACVRVLSETDGVRDARLEITSWKDGVATGRFAMATSGGPTLDFTFAARLDDPAGALRAASAPPRGDAPGR